MKKQSVHTSAAEAARNQYAALCYRYSAKGKLQILLVTSRDTGRWVLPKGWPMKDSAGGDLSGGECALVEAHEEAGIVGRLINLSIGFYSYRKMFGPDEGALCVVAVYPVLVERLLGRFPEQGQRARKWFTPAEAAGKVAEPELRALLTGFDPANFGEPGARNS